MKEDPGDQTFAEAQLACLNATYDLVRAIRRHDVSASRVARAHLEALLATMSYTRRVDVDLLGTGLSVEGMIANAEMYATGLPVIGMRDGRLFAFYPCATATFDPYPPLDRPGVIVQVCADHPPIVYEHVRMRLVEQLRAAHRRGEVCEVDLHDPAYADCCDGYAQDVRVPAAVPPDFLQTVRRCMRAYYDIVCAPKTDAPADPA